MKIFRLFALLFLLCLASSVYGQSTPTCLQGSGASCGTAATTTGNGATLNLNNKGGAGAATLSVLNSAGTFTVVVEISRDGDSYTTALVTKLADGSTAATITAAGKYTVLAPNMTIRARISACSSCATIVKAWPTAGFISKAITGGGGGGSGTVTEVDTGEGLTGGPITTIGTVSVDLSTLVGSQTLWDSSQASRTLTAGLSGATDPVVTFGNNSVDVTTGVLKYGGNTVATLVGAESLTNKKLGSLTSNGFVKTSGGDGTLSVDTTTYATAARAISTTSPLGGGGDLSADRTLTCTTCTTNASALTANLPVIGGGGNATAVGTRSGNTTQFVTTTGTLTSGDCVKIDASGNFIANGSACGGGITVGTTAITSGTGGRLAYETSGNKFGEITGVTSDGTSLTALPVAGVITQTSNSATAFESGPNGATNPVLRLVNNVASAATGLSITGNAAGSSVTLTALSSGTDEGIIITPKGAGNVQVSSGNLQINGTTVNHPMFARNGSTANLKLRTANDAAFASMLMANFYSLDGSSNFTGTFGQGATGIEWASGWRIAWSNSATDGTATKDTGISRVSAGLIGIGTGAAGSTAGSLSMTAETLSSATAPITFSNAAYQGCTGFTSSAGGVLTCTASSAKVKENFHEFVDGLNVIRNIQPQTFSYRNNTQYYEGGKVRLGLIAENLQSANPLLVSASGAGMLQPEPMALHAIEIRAIQQLEARIVALEAEIARLRK